MKFLTNKGLVSLGFFILFYLLCYFLNLKIALISSLLLILFIYIYDKDLLLILYIALLPTNGAIKNDYYLFGTINFDIVIYFLAIIVLFNRNSIIKSKISELQKFAIYMILTFLVYTCFTAFKDAAYHLFNMDYNHAFLRMLNYTLKLLPLILIIKLINVDLKLRDLVYTGIPIGIIILSFSMFFSTHLDSLGFKTSSIDIEETANATIYRTSGIFANGDKNSLGVFLVMFIGFLLTLKGREKIQKIYKITILISIFGILYTVSRTAIISLFVILAIFLFRSSIITTFKVIIIAISIIFLSPKAITPIIERFQYSEKELDYTNSSSRIGKWILYINHIRNEPGILLSGNTSNLYLNKWAARNKLLTASHNLYIEMVYRGGIIYLILTIILYFKLAKYIFKKENRFNGYYYLIPFILITFYTPDWGSFYYLGLFLSLGDKNTINVEKEQYKLIYQ